MSVHDTYVTLQGNVGGPVTLRRAGDALVATFRVGCTPGRFDRATSTWISQETQWFTVTAWRALAEHCEASLSRGDAVVVHGRMELRTWVNAQNLEQQSLEVQAITVGHDLSRGTSTFSRPQRPVGPAEPPAAGVATAETVGSDRLAAPATEGAAA